MKLNILSDLHLGHGGLPLPQNDADAVILAGDISRPQEAIAWALGFDKPVLYVPGNHEFYGGSIPGRLAELRRLCTGTNVRFLDDDEVIIDGVRFLGTTLWTDFMLFGDGLRRAAAIEDAQFFIRDFSHICVDESRQTCFSPADSVALFNRHAQWLERKLAATHAGPTVVISHHAPSPKSIHPRFADSLLNACFASDAEHLLDGNRVQLWIHGHMHDSFDYRVNGARVVCNPRGYVRDGVNENSRFDADFIVDVGTGLGQ